MPPLIKVERSQTTLYLKEPEKKEESPKLTEEGNKVQSRTRDQKNRGKAQQN